MPLPFIRERRVIEREEAGSLAERRSECSVDRGREAAMKIVVCVKQVAALGDEVEFTDDERDVDPDFLDFALNEWDTFATEEALRIRERAGDGEVVVVTVGDEDAEDAMRRCLAMGADRAIRDRGRGRGARSDHGRAGARAGRRGEEPDLVFCGVQSCDAVQAATGMALAELLGLPRVAVVTKVDWDQARQGDA